MKLTRIALMLATSAFVSACAYVPPNDGVARRVSPDYTATGAVDSARAYFYGKRTLLEFDGTPGFLAVRDENGVSVDYEKVGQYYRLNRRLDNFTVWVNGRSVTFTAVKEPKPVASSTAPVAAPVAAQYAPLPAASSPVKLASAGQQPRDGDAELQALLKLSQSQLEAIKKEITAAGNNPTATGAELFAAQARLDEIEARLSTVSAALVQVTFPKNGTAFKPSPAIFPTLIASAKAADQINIRGRTDSRGAGPIDVKVALGRAMSAKSYLVAHGVDGNKIKVQSQGAGDYAAPNMTKAGRALNRRVEIEIVNARIAELRGRASKLARGPQ